MYNIYKYDNIKKTGWMIAKDKTFAEARKFINAKGHEIPDKGIYSVYRTNVLTLRCTSPFGEDFSYQAKLVRNMDKKGMQRTYLDLSINERINLKSWWSLPLAYFFKNAALTLRVSFFSDPFVGGRTAQTKMESPQFETLFKGMSAEGEQFMRSWEQLVKFGGICR